MLFISYLHLIEGIGCRCGVIQEMVFFLNNAARDSIGGRERSFVTTSPGSG